MSRILEKIVPPCFCGSFFGNDSEPSLNVLISRRKLLQQAGLLLSRFFKSRTWVVAQLPFWLTWVGSVRSEAWSCGKVGEPFCWVAVCAPLWPVGALFAWLRQRIVETAYPGVKKPLWRRKFFFFFFVGFLTRCSLYTDETAAYAVRTKMPFVGDIFAILFVGFPTAAIRVRKIFFHHSETSSCASRAIAKRSSWVEPGREQTASETAMLCCSLTLTVCSPLFFPTWYWTPWCSTLVTILPFEIKMASFSKAKTAIMQAQRWAIFLHRGVCSSPGWVIVKRESWAEQEERSDKVQRGARMPEQCRAGQLVTNKTVLKIMGRWITCNLEKMKLVLWLITLHLFTKVNWWHDGQH